MMVRNSDTFATTAAHRIIEIYGDPVLVVAGVICDIFHLTSLYGSGEQ